MSGAASLNMATVSNLGAAIAAGRRNNLNLIRLLLASAVIVTHGFQLSLGPGWKSAGEPLMFLTRQQMSFGAVAVDLFFVISGLLITSSWFHSKSMETFLVNRVLRIYPGFVVASVFTALCAWLLCPEFRAEIKRGVVWSAYLLKDCALLSDTRLNRTPGIFANNPYPLLGNGSMWTIAMEFQCYLLVALLGLCCLFKRRLLVLGAALVCAAFYFRLVLLGDMDVAFAAPSRFLAHFLIGVNFWLWRDKIPFSGRMAFVCLLVLAAASALKPWFNLAFPLLGAYICFWFAYGPGISRFDWPRRCDISYGVYLYAFPIQQIVAMNPSLRNPWINILLATPFVAILGWLSRVWVEDRFLALKKAPRRDIDPGAQPEFVRVQV